MRRVGYVACMEKVRNVYEILVTKLEKKGPLRRPRLR
jgi:hypothetical protein